MSSDRGLLQQIQEFIAGNPNLAVAGVASAAAVVAVSYAMFSGGAVPLKLSLDANDQSVVIDGKPEHRASKLSKAPEYVDFDVPGPECKTVFDILERGKRLSGNGPCLGARTGPNREYEWMSYQQMIDKVINFGSGLVYKGCAPRNTTFIAIFATNRPEWTIADYGCQAYSMCPVPIYDTLGVDACKFILNQCEIETVVCDIVSRVKILVDHKSELPFLKRVVTIETMSEDVTQDAEKAGIELMTFEEVLELGQKNPQKQVPPKPDDAFSIVYTSGTTGNPKGVYLTHGAYVLMVQSITAQLLPHFMIQPGDIHLSYLPLAHSFDRACHVMLFLQGGQIGYFSRDIKLLTDDLMTLKPTMFPTVPRLLNRLYDAVLTGVKGSKIKSALLKWALASKQKDIDRCIIRKDTIWDKLIFSKVQNRLGGRVRILISGSAPLSDDVNNFVRCALGCLTVEGFGQTEAGAGLTLQIPGDPTCGSVGPPLPGVHIKLVDIPEMDYYAKDNVGEICAKAKFTLKEYYKEPEKTAESLDQDGWLHTGDIGVWLPNGTLKVIDRKKNIFKLAQGEYIAVERVENIYRCSPFISQIFVDGDSLKTCLMAVIVPDPQYLETWAKNNGFPVDIKEFCQHKDATDVVLKDMAIHAKKADLKGFEQVKDIYLEPEQFTIENDLLTPTLKNKRNVLRKMYKSTIDSLYAKNGL